MISDVLLDDGTVKEGAYDYWVNEHTCPTNIFRCRSILAGTDTDPHGIFQHVQTVIKPDNFDDLYSDHGTDYGNWCAIFSELPQPVTIEGVLSSPKLLTDLER